MCATAILTSACEHYGVPFHATVSPDATDGVDVRIEAENEVSLDLLAGNATTEAATTIEAGSESAWERAGLILLEDSPGAAPEVAHTEGLALVTEDPVDSLVHSTMIHGPFSGDQDGAADLVSRTGDDRDLASVVTLAAIEAAPTEARVADSIERVLQPTPTPDGPFLTAEGLADVLDVVVSVDPGVGLALACGDATAGQRAIELWRHVAGEIHRAIRGNTPTTSGTVAIYEFGELPAAPTARVLRDTRGTETVFVVTETSVALASRTQSEERLAEALPEPVTRHGDTRVSAPHDGASETIREQVREQL